MTKRDDDEPRDGEIIEAEPVEKGRDPAHQDKRGLFVRGNKMPGAGRPPGARSKIEEAFLRDFYNSWQRKGVDAIDRAADQDPMGYIRVAASLLPRVKPQGDDEGETNVNVNVNIQVSDFLGKLEAIAKRQAEMKLLAGPDDEPDENEGEK